MANKIKLRKQCGAVCPRCKHPGYTYLGRANNRPDGKHQFQCDACKAVWQYGKSDSVYLRWK